MQKFNKLWVIDGSFLLHRNLKVEELWNLRSEKTGLRTGGVFGFLRSLNYEFQKFDYFPIVIWDDGLSSRRTEVYPKYKRNHVREAERMLRSWTTELDPEEIAPAFKDHLFEKVSGDWDAYSEAIASIQETVRWQRSEEAKKHTPEDDYVLQYHRQRDVLINILHSLGVPSVRIKGWEGDDIMVIATRMADRSLVMTDDRDLIQLIAPNVDIYRPRQGEVLEYDSYLKAADLDDARELVISKAIEGDGSDNIPSVTSGMEKKYLLGATRAKGVAKMIMECEEDPARYLQMLRDTGKNYYQGFVERHDNYLRNMKLVDLSLVENDPEVMKTIEAEIRTYSGKGNFMNATSLLAEQQIVNFDLNAFISKQSIQATRVIK